MAQRTTSTSRPSIADVPVGDLQVWDWPRIRFTLLRLLIFITVIGILLAYPAWIIRRTSRDRAIEREIAGPNVSIGHNYLGPRWLRGILGEDRCRVIQSIHCYGGTVPQNLERLRQLADLRYLSIEHCDLQDADVERMGVLPQVRSLSLSYTCITPRSLKTIRLYPELTNLRIWDVPINGRDLELLRGAPRLATVRGRFTVQEIEQAQKEANALLGGFEELSNPPSIPPLSRQEAMTSPDVAREDLHRLLGKRLSPPQSGKPFAITLDQPFINDGHLAVLGDYPPITTLYLTSKEVLSISPKGLSLLQDQPHLVVVRLTGRTTAAHLKALCQCKGIEELRLQCPADDLGPEGFEYLADLPALKRLDIRCFRLRDEHLLALEGCKRLEQLNLDHASLCTSHGLAVIQHFPALTELNVGHTRASNRLLPHLLSRTRLTNLHIQGTLLDHQGQAALANIPTLRGLWIGGYPFMADPAVVSTIQRKLPACHITAF